MNEFNRSIISGLQVLMNHQWGQNHAVVIEDKKIKAIIPAEMSKHHLPAKIYHFKNDCYLIPGLIDLHIHGINGDDVMDATEKSFNAISKNLAREGITGFLATTMTAKVKQIEAVLELIPAAMAYSDGAAILGVHLEGPFIAKEKIGAHDGHHTHPLHLKLIKILQKKAQGNIRLVTMAPELENAVDFIHTLKELEIIPAIGHTNATYDETQTAISAGCNYATHLFNAMRGLHQREPGAAGAILLAEEVTAELIVDGLHLHPAIVEIVYKLKGKDRLVLVTDAMRAKCLGDGEYELGGQQVKVKDQRASLTNGTLAGSLLRLPDAVRNMAQFSKCDLIEAIYMASLNPARLLRLSARKGSIDIGKDADLVVWDANFNVQLTLREGKEIFSV